MAVITDNDGNFLDENGKPTTTRTLSTKVKNITFMDNLVRVELSCYNSESKSFEEGWVLYCTKADDIADISGIDIADYDGCQTFNMSDAFADWQTDFVHATNYSYYKGRTALCIGG